MASVNVSSILIIDPRNRHTVYSGTLPTTHAASDGIATPEGAVFMIPYLGGNYGIAVHVSALPSAGGGGPALTIYGAAWDGPSVAPTDRNWCVVRGDTATGANVRVQGVTCNQFITVISPAMAYKVVVSSSVGDVTNPLTFNVFAFDKTYNW